MRPHLTSSCVRMHLTRPIKMLSRSYFTPKAKEKKKLKGKYCSQYCNLEEKKAITDHYLDIRINMNCCMNFLRKYACNEI